MAIALPLEPREQEEEIPWPRPVLTLAPRLDDLPGDRAPESGAPAGTPAGLPGAPAGSPAEEDPELPWPVPDPAAREGRSADDGPDLREDPCVSASPPVTARVPSGPAAPWTSTVGTVLGFPGPAPRVGFRIVEGADVSARRRVRASRRVVRRRVAALAVVVAAAVLLALPVSALGGRPAAPARAGATAVAGSGATAAAVYVVQPGDTLWSIAGRLSGGIGTRAVVQQLVALNGSQVVWPGEHLRIP